MATGLLQALSAAFITELKYKGVLLIPGIGSFSVKRIPALPGRLKKVGGVLRACGPRAAKCEIQFSAFSDVEELLSGARCFDKVEEADRQATPASSSASVASSSASRASHSD
eukprot:539514-Pyramimonas_sp.AAC.1